QGPDLLSLERYTNELRERSLTLGGIIDSDTTLKLDRTELRARVDRERAADLGVRTEDIATALRLMVGGDERVSRYRDASTNENYEVQLRLSERDRDQVSAIRRLQVPRSARAGGGTDAPGLVPLESVIVIDEGNSPSRIDRLDRQRVASLRAGVGPGYALADRLDALRGAVRDMNLPPEYSASVRG